jgi:cytidyltransferase-like protein
MTTKVLVTGGFDDLRAHQVRFLHAAADLGELHVHLWPDEAIAQRTGQPPKFPYPERHYLLSSLRYVSRILPSAPPPKGDGLPGPNDFKPDLWVVDGADPDLAARIKAQCQSHSQACCTVAPGDLAGFPEPIPQPFSGRKKVLVTGCYDWFHSGHVRFFEEVSQLGDLIAVVGNDANVRLLKGEGHPMFAQDERRYLVGAIRFVHLALVATGQGWLDAEPEIRRLQPDIYAVNEDGDKPEKSAYCAQHGIEYRVLKRTPKEGLPKRQSTALRGF